MNSDDFEKQLKRQELRPVPSHWRDQILSAARHDSVAQTSGLPYRRSVTCLVDETPQPSSQDNGASRLRWLIARVRVRGLPWREWLWPCPEAWAGLAAVWLVILGLNVTPFSGAPMARHTAPSDATLQLAEQRRELARLLDLSPDSTPTPLPNPPPGPRSEGTAPSKA